MTEQLQPLSKKEALESIKQFRRDFHLKDKADWEEIKRIREKVGSLTE